VAQAAYPNNARPTRSFPHFVVVNIRPTTDKYRLAAPNRPRGVHDNVLKNKQKTITLRAASRLRTSRQISYRKRILRSSFSVLRVDGFALPPPTAWPSLTSLEQAFSVLG
jgi:hypothetical protein